MTCKDALDLSSLYLSRELGASRMAEARRHLDACPACAAEFEHMADLDLRLRDALLSEHIDSGAIEQQVREAIAPRRRWIAFASIAAALVIGFLAFQASIAQDKMCAAAASDHRRELVNGEHRTWRTDLAAIAELAGSRGISVPQIAPDGYILERGKLCRLNGRVFLHLVYSDGAGELSMFLAPGGASSTIRNLDSGAEHVVYFGTPRTSAIIVTDEPGDSAARMARSAERAL